MIIEDKNGMGMDMKGKSHALLGNYLAEEYLDGVSAPCVKAFLVGCIEPDRNPATYLKGSLRSQWLRGHNWGNAQKYMERLCDRLERKEKLGIFSWYCLGKLIHYTVDAFTYAHNEEFTENLKQHNAYERALEEYFLDHFGELAAVKPAASGNAMETIRSYHESYLNDPFDIRTDCRYAMTVCCCVLALLVPGKLLCGI